ncbi:hypothetical protein RvY_09651-2 [Ramazzottius varieornatus]|uniref:Uncharacterized protein n=1 Tax=Ramazzottius varieornatus TaxID=947166 RepID=A0A1D1VA53_RAMVA|nr:hypothetical protein RvY_09651-2 [Ramazzottius varieornatus]
MTYNEKKACRIWRTMKRSRRRRTSLLLRVLQNVSTRTRNRPAHRKALSVLIPPTRRKEKSRYWSLMTDRRWKKDGKLEFMGSFSTTAPSLILLLLIQNSQLYEMGSLVYLNRVAMLSCYWTRRDYLPSSSETLSI